MRSVILERNYYDASTLISTLHLMLGSEISLHSSKYDYTVAVAFSYQDEWFPLLLFLIILDSVAGADKGRSSNKLFHGYKRIPQDSSRG